MNIEELMLMDCLWDPKLLTIGALCAGSNWLCLIEIAEAYILAESPILACLFSARGVDMMATLVADEC